MESILRSRKEYRKKIDPLSWQVHDIFDRVQIAHRVFFLTGSYGIIERVKERVALCRWGKCQISFAEVKEFLKSPEAFGALWQAEEKASSIQAHSNSSFM
ncbi:MAG: hypothetical protein A2901_01025 [Elusimicrobia bacterium RIFCSPLOWO2_01_FULL_54_10]|nr:MAG: hypothetical protein A2901_01025 [Elusimicrobia bacterium RIFCSPLOWO2_01_FULL_54_10]